VTSGVLEKTRITQQKKEEKRILQKARGSILAQDQKETPPLSQRKNKKEERHNGQAGKKD